MSDLQGAHAKVERARQHIENLKTEKANFFKSNPYSATPEYHPDHNVTVFHLDSFVPVPPAIGLIAGDAAHNLRSALDFLAFALYARNAEGNGRHIYFPISENFEKYTAELDRKVNGIDRRYVEAISLIKPYGGGEEALWGLHQMDIIDKHRLLLTPVISATRITFRITSEFIERELGRRFRISDEGSIKVKTAWFDIPTAQWLAVKQGDPVAAIKGNRELHRDVDLAFDIALGEPETFKGKPILETLERLSQLVSGIIDGFELL